MGLILDSSVLVAAERQGKNARQMLSTISAKTSEAEIGISVVTLIELAITICAFMKASRRRRELLC